MSTRKSNPPPPPPPRQGVASSTGTATTAPSTDASPYYYSLSEIDDDSTAARPPNNNHQTNTSFEGGDDTTEIDDNDSILEMAKRLDAASVISDPTIIEGPHNNYDGHPSWGANRMDDIASEESASSSESEEDSSSSSSSTSSSESEYHRRERYEYKNQQRHHHGARRNREGRRRFDNSSRNYSEEGVRSHHRGNNGRSSDRRRREHRQRNNNPRQHQQHSSSMPSQPYYDNTYDGRGHHQQQQQQQQQMHNMSYPGGGERKYSPPRGATAVPIDPMMMHTSNIPNNNNNQSRGGYREDPTNNMRSFNSHENQSAAEAYEKKQKQERYYDREDTTESAKRRRTKMIMIPSIVIVIIGAVVTIAVVVGKGNGDGSAQNFQDQFDDNSNAFRPIPVPTTSPTYFGLYQCKIGEGGPTVTKGCLGFIECSMSGAAMGPIQYCSSGTLYDVGKGVCDFAENVACSTNLPTQEEFAGGNTPPIATPPTTTTTTPGGGGVSWMPPPAPTPQNPPVSPPTALQQQKPPSFTVGPITTSNNKLLFEGVVNPGQLDNNAMNRIADNLKEYLNIFYSARVINAYNDGDYVLENIGNVTIGVVLSRFEFVQNSKRRRNLLRRDLQTAANGLAMIYQQTTKYDTIDSAITVEAIVRHPYQERYQDRIVSYLKAVDPGVFSSLKRVSFVEGDVGGQPAPIQQPVSVPAPTRKPTIAPTKQVVSSPPVPETNPPTKAPATSPPVTATVVDNSVTYTIQGFMFLDENQNGIFEYANEKPFAGVLANLRLCNPKEDGNDYVKSEFSADLGLYQFNDVKKNEYFIEFSKPSPGDDYDFTTPQVAGNDDSVLDSDVDEIGKTACFTVGPGFDPNKFINAGFTLKPTPPPSPAPSKSPIIDVPKYCADATTSSTGDQNLDFLRCAIRCGDGFEECPGSLLCARADECVEPI